MFGSVLRQDFHSESDIDVLVTFASKARITGLDLVDMEEELRTIFDRNVDVVSKRGVENSRNATLRQEILATAEVIYAQAA